MPYLQREYLIFSPLDFACQKEDRQADDLKRQCVAVVAIPALHVPIRVPGQCAYNGALPAVNLSVCIQDVVSAKLHGSSPHSQVIQGKRAQLCPLMHVGVCVAVNTAFHCTGDNFLFSVKLLCVV